MSTKAIPHMLLLGSLWGSSLVISRFGVGQFDALIFVSLRLLIASIVFLAVFTFSRQRNLPRDKNMWRHGVILGVIGTAIPMTGFITALQFQSSGVTSILATTAPAITAILAHLFLADEKLNRNKSFGIILALGGTMLLIALGESGLLDLANANPIGYVLVMGGLFFGAVGTIYIRKYMRDFDSFDVTSIRIMVAAVILLPASIFYYGLDFSAVTSQGFMSLIYATMAGAFGAQLLGFSITRRFGATAFASSTYITPVVASILGIWLLGEVVTGGMIAGIVLIFAGIFTIQRFG